MALNLCFSRPGFLDRPELTDKSVNVASNNREEAETGNGRGAVPLVLLKLDIHCGMA
jgi:hypothetical protein